MYRLDQYGSMILPHFFYGTPGGVNGEADAQERPTDSTNASPSAPWDETRHGSSSTNRGVGADGVVSAYPLPYSSRIHTQFLVILSRPPLELDPSL